MEKFWDLQNELQKAWSFIWKENVQMQKERDPLNRWFYVCATDLQRRLKSAAAEIWENKEYGSLGLDGGWYSGVKIKGLGGVPLLQICRKWLFQQVRLGKLEVHDPTGHNTCSGARFRPKGAPLSPGEEKAPSYEEKKRQKWIVHFAREDGKASCGANDKKKAKMTAYPRRPVYKPKPTQDKTKVSCKKCLKLLEQKEVVS